MNLQKTININEYESLFRDHYSELCAFANKYLNDLAAAEEVVQSFFVKFWEKRDSLTQVQSKRAYFYSSVKNACLNQLKHIEVREEYKLYNQREMEAQDYGVDEEFEANELSEKIRQSIDKLPEGRRKIFIMSRYDGLKYKEIAKKLKISIKTVENQMGSAIKYLKLELADYLIVLIILFNL